MRIINVKKLIVSTLIFLFTSFHEQVLADTVQADNLPPVVQESVYAKAPPDVHRQWSETIIAGGHLEEVLLSHPRIVTPKEPVKAVNFALQSASMETHGIQQLFAFPFSQQNAKLSTSLAPYTNGNDGYIYFGPQAKLPQNQLTEAYQSVLLASNQYNVAPSLLTAELAPSIFSAKGFHGNLLILPQLQPTAPKAMLIDLEILLVVLYLGFRGMKLLKKDHLHTGLWGKEQNQDPFITTTLMIAAANLAALESVSFYVGPQEEEHVQKATRFLTSQAGKPMDEVLENLTL